MTIASVAVIVRDWRGTGTVSGTVRAKTGPSTYAVVPGAEVVLFEQSCVPRAKMYAAADGTFAFTGLDTSRQWMVLAIHPSGAYSAVATDRLAP